MSDRNTDFKSATNIRTGDLIFVGGSLQQVNNIETYDAYTLFIYIDGQDIPLTYDKYEQIEVPC